MTTGVLIGVRKVNESIQLIKRLRTAVFLLKYYKKVFD